MGQLRLVAKPIRWCFGIIVLSILDVLYIHLLESYRRFYEKDHGYGCQCISKGAEAPLKNSASLMSRWSHTITESK